MKKPNQNKGFTLVEILLYFAVVSIVLFAIMSFSIQILDASQKSSNIQEIQTNMDFISAKLTHAIQESESIDVDNSDFDEDSGALSLNMEDLDKSPTQFYLGDNDIYLKEGGDNEIKINSDAIKCPQLRFSRITQSKIPDQIMIDIQCEPINFEINQDIKIHTTVSLRK